MEAHNETKNIDFSHAVEIAPRVWWVGCVDQESSMQSHTYLIEQEENSVLIDPGSKLTFPDTLRKINEVISFNSIKYFVCQHQDPDIAGALPLVDQLVFREDAQLVTHGWGETFLRYYDSRLPCFFIEENNWRLDLDGRILEFCFTPYVHSSSAFVTYDSASRVMFSSDIFGSFSNKFSLFAEDASYAKSMKPFHQKYMPSRKILCHALKAIEGYDIEIIAPQHGSIIRKELIPVMMEELKDLKCGLLLLLQGKKEVRHLQNFDTTMHNITVTMTHYRDFHDIATALFTLVKEEIAVRRLEFHVRDRESRILRYTPRNSFGGVTAKRLPATVRKFFQASEEEAADYRKQQYELEEQKEAALGHAFLHIPLFLPESSQVGAVASLLLDENVEENRIASFVAQLSMPLQIAIERENMYRELEQERNKMYQRSIRDPLTGLYTRMYMNDVVQKILDQQDRNKEGTLVTLVIDIDHFKRVNDTWGHIQGDNVLRKVAQKIMKECRQTDIPVRIGGEEFVIFSQVDEEGGESLAMRLLQAIAAIKWKEPMEKETITISIGVALHKREESLESLLSRSDEALYEAKEQGRNRVCCAF